MAMGSPHGSGPQQDTPHGGASRLRMRLPSPPLILAGVALLLGGCATQHAPREWDGLRLEPRSTLDQVYLRPNAQFAGYRRVQLDPATVAFDRSWDPNATRALATRVTPEDLRRIQTELAQLLHDGLAAELARGGYQLTGESGEDVLRVTPQITDLYVNAPDTRSAGIVRTYVMDAGRMTLVVEARDSTTGQLLARVVDTRRGTNTGQLQWANSVTNSAEARRAIDHWSRVLREGLDELHRR